MKALTLSLIFLGFAAGVFAAGDEESTAKKPSPDWDQPPPYFILFGPMTEVAGMPMQQAVICLGVAAKEANHMCKAVLLSAIDVGCRYENDDWKCEALEKPPGLIES